MIPSLDTHQHLIAPEPMPYSWTGDQAALKDRSFTDEDYRRAIAETGIERTIFMEAMPDDPRVEWRQNCSIGASIMRKNWKSLLAFIALTQGIGLSGSLPTRSAIESGWYKTLDQPEWRPPALLFAPIWALLYLLMAVAAWRVSLQRDDDPDAIDAALVLWTGQLALNAAWSWIFFGARKPKIALAEIVALWLAIAATARAFWKIDRAASIMLWPYLAWVTFAIALNGSIATRNA